MTAGGKRKGAGRPVTREPWMRVQFSLSQETVILLRDLIPAYERSAWVDEIILKALRTKQKTTPVRTS
jgi:hypothetical protein